MAEGRRGIRRGRKKDEEVAKAEASQKAVEQEAAEQEAEATEDAAAEAAADTAAENAKAEDAKQAAAEEEVEAEAAEAEGEPEPEEEDATPADESKGGRRRGSEVAPARKQTAPPPRDREGAIAVRATAKYVRCAPRKARLVVDHIRGRPVEQARAILLNTPRVASRDVLKLLDSAVANAENNHELVADELVIRQAYVDEGPTLKRYRPRALGRATRIRKRTSHMTITLTTTDGAG